MGDMWFLKFYGEMGYGGGDWAVSNITCRCKVAVSQNFGAYNITCRCKVGNKGNFVVMCRPL